MTDLERKTSVLYDENISSPGRSSADRIKVPTIDAVIADTVAKIEATFSDGKKRPASVKN